MKTIKYIIQNSIRGDFIKNLTKTVAYVTLFSIIERVLGFIYRIYLSRTILSEGVGLYQIALTIFGLLLTITSSGIPITVSRMMTRFKTENNKPMINSTISAGIFLCLALSIPIVIILFVFKKNFSFIFSDPRCMNILMIILPGLILTSVYAVIRGSFWGNKDFLPYSLIELLEETVMLVVGVILINRATSMLDGVTKAAWAVLASYIFSFITACIVFFIKKGKFSSPFKTLPSLVSSSLPITSMRTATSLINSIIAVLLPERLIAAGLSNSQAIAQFGTAFGMAIPILFMPSTLIGSLAVVLVPELSENFYKKQTKTLKHNIERALKFSIFIACIIIPVLISFGKNLGVFFYNSPDAGKYLKYSAVTMLPMSISMISTSMLNSMNLEKKTLLYYLFGASFMMVCIYFLPHYIGIYSLMIGFFGQFFITALLNVYILRKKITANINISKFAVKSVLFTIPTLLFGFMLNNILSTISNNTLTCIIGSLSVVIFNLILYIIFGMVDLKNPNKIR